jgi:hypothetical protein
VLHLDQSGLWRIRQKCWVCAPESSQALLPFPLVLWLSIIRKIELIQFITDIEFGQWNDWMWIGIWPIDDLMVHDQRTWASKVCSFWTFLAFSSGLNILFCPGGPVSGSSSSWSAVFISLANDICPNIGRNFSPPGRGKYV